MREISREIMSFRPAPPDGYPTVRVGPRLTMRWFVVHMAENICGVNERWTGARERKRMDINGL